MDAKWVMSALMIFFVLLFIFIIVLFSLESAQCRVRDKAIAADLNGVVTRVFNDKTHHNYETVFVQEGKEEKRTYIFLYDESGCFEYLQPGDSIVKRDQCLLLDVIRNGEVKTFTLKYDCKGG